ncbi:MAG: hypothetical protein ACOYNL_06165 [Rickettsiales bacterium]
MSPVEHPVFDVGLELDLGKAWLGLFLALCIEILAVVVVADLRNGKAIAFGQRPRASIGGGACKNSNNADTENLHDMLALKPPVYGRPALCTIM